MELEHRYRPASSGHVVDRRLRDATASDILYLLFGWMIP